MTSLDFKCGVGKRCLKWGRKGGSGYQNPSSGGSDQEESLAITS